MESGWIVNYKNGKRIIMNEKAHETWKSEGKIKTEEHWFDIDKAITKNPGTEILVL